MRVASLFSGIGGFELALGGEHELVLLNEIDPACQSVLAARFPHTPVIPDVADVDRRHLADADLLVAGFPCQDVSIVGGQMGMAGTRTSLVRHVFRLVEEARPARFLLENVQSIRFVHGGRVLFYLMSEAERLGYRWAYRTLDSLGFGLPQRRRRFYFAASRVDDPADSLFADQGIEAKPGEVVADEPIGFYWTEGRKGHGLTRNAIPPLKTGSALGIPSPPAVLLPDGQVVTPAIEAAEILQGFPPEWTSSAPTRARWGMMGNAVSPPVARWLIQALGEGRGLDRSRLLPMPERPTWPTAGRGGPGETRFAVLAGEAPTTSKLGRLSDLDLQWVPLSKRALHGFVTRARDGNLRYPEGFLERLDQALLRWGT